MFFFHLVRLENDNRIANWVHRIGSTVAAPNRSSVQAPHHIWILERNVVVGAVLEVGVAATGDEDGMDVFAFGDAVFEVVAEHLSVKARGDVLPVALVGMVKG